MRIATWNVNSLTARWPRVEAWVRDAQPDVLCLQETKQTEAAFPHDRFDELGYRSAHHGEGRWNGVAVVSRVGLDSVARGLGPKHVAAGARLVGADCGGVRVYSVYVPNGRSLDSEHYQTKLAWLAGLRELLATTCDPGSPVVVCGDFNVAPEDRDVWDAAAMEGMTHVSGPEREALVALCDWGLTDVFRRFDDRPAQFSWWDYRGGAFHRGHGMRIDLVLATEVVADATTAAVIDREARKGEKPSDHAPVYVDVKVP